MNDSVILWENDLYPDETVSINLPLSSKIDVSHLRQELGMPDYIDTTYLPVERTVVTQWIVNNCHKIWGKFKKPFKMLLFGGGAIKICCPSANTPGSVLNRPLHDVDFIISKKAYRGVKDLLPMVSDYAGTRYLYFFTPFDRRFNGLRGGRRILVHSIHGIGENGIPEPGLVDILVDRVEMRHTIDVRRDLKEADDTTFTIKLHNLLLTKTQMIFDVDPRELMDKEKYRVLNKIYGHFSSRRVLMGMEEKDMLDVCALLLDHNFGAGPDEIDVDELIRILKKDKKLLLTVRLNLENLLLNISNLLNSEDIKARNIVKRRVAELLEALPDSTAKWSKPWWNTSVDIPALG